jgi:hypothetical protein
MRCERLSKCLFVFAFVAACSREQPAPPPVTLTETSARTPPLVTPSTVTTPIPAMPAKGSYDEAMLWLRSAPSFRFAIDEGGVHAEGTMTRPTIGAEKIEIRTSNESWRAAAGPQGVTWQKRVGGAWKAAPAPAYGNHLYQRVTLAFDPSKKEGAAQLAGVEGDANHYRFTDANTGNVHDVWVSRADSHVERMKIGDVMELTIQK